MTPASSFSGRRLLHVTTTDISLALLLGSQLRACVAAGFEVVAASAPGPWVQEIERWGVRHWPLRHATRSVDLGEDVRALWELARLFRRIEPDIVHTHNPKPGVYGRVAARLAGVKRIVNTVHGLYATREDPLARRLAVYSLERTASACSHAELVVNAEDLVVLSRLRVPSRKLVLLGGGVDLARFRPRNDPESRRRAREIFGCGPERVVVGTVGRLVWEKGYRELFQAAAALSVRRPEVLFVVAGPEDPAKPDALRGADMDAARELGNVVFLGVRSDVELLHAGFDICALPSHREGLPLTAMEAAASGIPVVATDIRGCRQVVDDGSTGLLVPVRDAGALTAAIGSLADDPDRRRSMGAAARRRAEERFDQRHVVDKTLGVYERLLV